MPSQDKFDPAETDRLMAAGRQQFENFDRSHRNVRARLEHQFRPRSTSVYRTISSIAAAFLLLAACLWIFNPGGQGDYLALAEELRTPFSTESLSVKRGASSPASPADIQRAKIARAINFYHGDEPLRAAPLWHELAGEAVSERRSLFRFYEATAYWLAGAPDEAIEGLLPLAASLPKRDPLLRKCHYALGLAYLDNGEIQKAVSRFELVSELKDKMGKSSARLLSVLHPKEGGAPQDSQATK